MESCKSGTIPFALSPVRQRRPARLLARPPPTRPRPSLNNCIQPRLTSHQEVAKATKVAPRPATEAVKCRQGHQEGREKAANKATKAAEATKAATEAAADGSEAARGRQGRREGRRGRPQCRQGRQARTPSRQGSQSPPRPPVRPPAAVEALATLIPGLCKLRKELSTTTNATSENHIKSNAIAATRFDHFLEK